MPQGSVVRFDRRKGYGFIQPEDGGEDVFVHQNNINMEGFRFLNIGEKVSYELEVGEKGMKAVAVSLLEPRKPGDDGGGDFGGQQQQERMGPPRPGPRPRPFPGNGNGGGAPRAFDRGDRPERGGDLGQSLDRLRRKQERLVSLLVEKGIIIPADIDSDTPPAAAAAAQA